MAAINLTLPDDLLAQIDAARGDVPRVRWIRRAVEQALVPGGDAPRQRAHSKSEADVAITPAPAEQPRAADMTRTRSSAQVKGDIKPIPKGGKS